MGDPEEIRIVVNGVEYASLDAVPPALRPLAEKQLEVAREAVRGRIPQAPAGKVRVKFNIDIRRSDASSGGAPPAAVPPPAVTTDSRWPAVGAALLVLAAAAAWLWLKR